VRAESECVVGLCVDARRFYLSRVRFYSVDVAYGYTVTEGATFEGNIGKAT